jgi:hypothetical protein
MSPSTVTPGIYQHSKSGKLYRVHFAAKHSETLEDVVVYETLYDNPAAKFWVRPAAMFQELVDVRGERVPRFAYLRES